MFRNFYRLLFNSKKELPGHPSYSRPLLKKKMKVGLCMRSFEQLQEGSNNTQQTILARSVASRITHCSVSLLQSDPSVFTEVHLHLLNSLPVRHQWPLLFTGVKEPSCLNVNKKNICLSENPPHNLSR